MRKIVSTLLVVAMLFTAVAVLASCSSSSSDEFKIGVICLHDENSTYDNNFIRAINNVKKDLGLKDSQVIVKTNIPESDECYNTAKELVEKGCNVIFADSFGHESFMLQAAKEYPDVEFCHATGTLAHVENVKNYHNAFASIYEGRYLAGIAAGMKLNELIEAGKFTAEEAVIGYVGAFTYAEVISGMTSFFLGARSVCPTATMKVRFTGSWYDQAGEQEAANSLIADGCKLISQHADSLGAPTACENAGIPNVSYNGSTQAAGPNTYIISSAINWEPYFKYIIDCAQNGKTIDTDWTGTIDTGSVIINEINESVAAAGTKEALDKAMADLKAGTVHVFDTSKFTVNGEALTSDWKPGEATDGAFKEGTKVVYDGYLHESEYRSAPYFDVTIDGVEFLNVAF